MTSMSCGFSSYSTLASVRDTYGSVLCQQRVMSCRELGLYKPTAQDVLCVTDLLTEHFKRGGSVSASQQIAL